MFRIDGYGFGFIRIDGRRYCLRDVILYPDGTVRRRKSGRWVGSHHKLGIADMSDVVDMGATNIIIGTGRFSGLKISDRLRESISEAGAELVVLPSREAVGKFNDLVGRDSVKVGAFFHLMC